jgi:hypothetical protein
MAEAAVSFSLTQKCSKHFSQTRNSEETKINKKTKTTVEHFIKTNVIGPKIKQR